jgi:hypothetical protein
MAGVETRLTLEIYGGEKDGGEGAARRRRIPRKLPH